MLIPRLPMRIWWSSSMNWNRSCRTASTPTASAPDQTGISMSVTVEGKAAAARTILNIRNMQSIDDVQISNITDSKDETGDVHE